MPANTSTSESAIRFFRSGGHKHDGVSSSLIDFSKYSIFDFGTDNTTSGQDAQRDITRQNNQNRFNQYIANFISTQILAPAGIELLENSVRGVHIGANEITANNIAANTITANEIASNTITAAELAINVVQVGDTISSNNYVLGTTGWQIRSNGSAEFNNNIIVRGQIEATSGNFTGTINAGGTFANGSVSNGAITGGSLTIGTDPNVFKVYSNGSMSLGNGTFLSAPFRVTNGGALTANSGNIGGWSISSTTLSGGSTTLYSNGYIVATGSSFTSASYGGGSITDANINAGASAFNANGYIKSILGNLASFALGTNSFVQGSVTLRNSVKVDDGTRLTDISGGIVYFKYTGVNAGSIAGGVDPFLGIRTITHTGSNFFDASPLFYIYNGGSNVSMFAQLPTGTGSNILYSSGQFVRAVSRREYKYDIQSVENAINKVKLLNPVTFKFRVNENSSNIIKYLKDNDIKTGFIVEDVESVDRGLINYDHVYENGPVNDSDFDNPSNFVASSYDINGIVSILTKAVQELIIKIENIEGVMSNGA